VAPVEVHESSVQARVSKQIAAAPAVHVPYWQVSLTVHPFESALQAVPYVLFDQADWLVVLVHCWHGFDGFASPFV
jgi:hypothetical protein